MMQTTNIATTALQTLLATCRRGNISCSLFFLTIMCVVHLANCKLSPSEFVNIMHSNNPLKVDKSAAIKSFENVASIENSVKGLKYAANPKAQHVFKDMSKYTINAKQRNIPIGCPICKYIANSVNKYKENIRQTWKDLKRTEEKERLTSKLIYEQACFPVINKKIARIVHTEKGDNKNMQLRYIHYDELMITKIDGSEDIATSLGDKEEAYLVNGCSFVKDNLSSIVTEVFMSKYDESLEEILCSDVIRVCDTDITETEKWSRRLARKKLEEEADKRILRTGKTRAPGTSAG